MKYVFTKHAKERMVLRRINRKGVINTIKKNELKALDDETENKVAFYKKWTEKFALKVVTIKNEFEIRIITVHPVSLGRLKNIKNLIEIK
ncbi:MAG: DUF4258 domain-containing protein [Patescibacteria group bacterium]